MNKIALFVLLTALCATASASNAQSIGFGASSIGSTVLDTTPRPPQIVTTYPSSVSDEALLGYDSLASSVTDLDISFGAGSSASAKTSSDNAVEAAHQAILDELRALRLEVAALREEVNGRKRKKKRRRNR
ncbi:MAG: hypothetical protein AB8F78_10725 [Saprospiraceae bacterium]